MIDRTSYIRLLEQSIRALGYEDVALSLEAASGVQQSSPTARRFRVAVLAGEVDVALALLEELEEELLAQEMDVEAKMRGHDTRGSGPEAPGPSTTTSLSPQTSTSIQRRVRRRVEQARYLLFCNMFRSLVEAGEAGKALKCLREDIQPLETSLRIGDLENDGGRGGTGRNETGVLEDVDMEDARLAEFPPLSASMETLRASVGLRFGDFPSNFGVLSTLGGVNAGPSVASVTKGDHSVGTSAMMEKFSKTNKQSPPSLSALASLLLQSDRGAPPLPPKRLREHTDVDIHRQEELLRDLQLLLSPEVLIPDNRLETLVEQALTSQIQRCPYHNTSNMTLSLMSDYYAGPDSLPTIPAHTLTLHADEVWVVQFSPDGRWLVSASKDGSAILWDVQCSKKVLFSRILHSGRVPINICAFSPSSQEVLIGSNDGKIRVFKVNDGELITELTGRSAPGASPSTGPHHDVSVSSAMWGNSSSKIALSCNKELRMIDIDISGWKPGNGVQAPKNVTSIRLQNHTYDSVLSADGGTFVSVGQDRMIRYVRMSDGMVVTRGPEPAAVTCLSRSTDGKYLASNLANGCIHIWQLGNLQRPGEGAGSDVDMTTGAGGGATDRMVSSLSSDVPDPMESLPDAPLYVLKGLQTSQPGRFVIRSAFGGIGDAFVGTGSENALVHIWHRETETLLASVEGHQATVNAVAWNPRNHHMLASASDDHKVIIWLSRKHLSE